MTTYGMDTGAGLATGAELERGAQEIESLAARVDGALASFDWAGPDADRVRETWTTTERPLLEAVGRGVAAMALAIRQEAQAQDDASGDAGGGQAQTTVAGSPGTPADDPSDGRVPAQTAERWARMTDAERRAALEEQSRRLAQRYGIQPPPRVVFLDMEDTNGDGVDDHPSTNSHGSYSHGQRVLRMDTNDVSNAYALNTMAHEMRHAAQHDMADRYQQMGIVGRGLVRIGISDDPFVARGSTLDEVGTWQDNFDDYTTPAEDFGRYHSQPVEADARRHGDAYADRLTPGGLEQLRRPVGTP